MKSASGKCHDEPPILIRPDSNLWGGRCAGDHYDDCSTDWLARCIDHASRPAHRWICLFVHTCAAPSSFNHSRIVSSTSSRTRGAELAFMPSAAGVAPTPYACTPTT